MAICVVCNEVCDEVSDIKCSGGCGIFIHIICLKSDTEGKKTRSGKEWSCKVCRVQSAHSVKSNSSATSSSISKDFLINVMEGLKKEVFEEFKTSRNKMLDLSKSVQFVSDKLDASNSLMEEIKKQFGILKKENEELRVKNSVLTEEVIDLRERMRSIEQYSRKNNVEVSGVPATREENVLDLVVDIGTAIGMTTEVSDVAAAHRVPSFKKDREPS